MVAAVDAPPGQIDDDVRTVDFRRPSADRLGIPPDDPPGSLAGIAAEDHYLMAVGDEGTSQQCANLAASAWDDNLHVSGRPSVFVVASLRLPTAREGAA
jgi:hypothetical protein